MDAHPDVEWWVRNVDRQPGSFWLPLSHGRFFPDFVARLKDGRTLVLEYKGEHLATGDDAREKQSIGELWSAGSNGQTLFLMALREDEQGRHLALQIQDCLAGK
ncbi:hypothetical protein [Desulfonatronum thiosulfatophilum]|uniref:hypothetical protein n=1 Tax=Desulfonatronum thiosulfatophilum TaxID=617002 RepID=UPI000AB54DBC|nr:hypothetical protein [Desulfonatronum thiosulfatophilum]